MIVQVSLVGLLAALSGQSPTGADTPPISDYQKDRRGFFMRFDQDHDGRLTPDEFHNAGKAALQQLREAGLKGWAVAGDPHLFSALDVNKDGYVQPEEIDEETMARVMHCEVEGDHCKSVAKPAAKPKPVR